jgi:hypothetical protein
VLCIDEKSQVQALDRTAPVLPLRMGMPAKQTADYVRHGTTTLFAALEVATGKVTDACYPRHRHEGFLRFLKQVAKAYPRRRLHIACDNYATHEASREARRLARHRASAHESHFPVRAGGAGVDWGGDVAPCRVGVEAAEAGVDIGEAVWVAQ